MLQRLFKSNRHLRLPHRCGIIYQIEIRQGANFDPKHHDNQSGSIASRLHAAGASGIGRANSGKRQYNHYTRHQL
ncbi:MAG: hypothetical protein DLM69_06380 [Candidatus Chloroheliales bacterium]|nr:MAG: hypothetical protein DLM69_06380 [Chloroflexota bacterium]